jgi:hypothetical protein
MIVREIPIATDQTDHRDRLVLSEKKPPPKGRPAQLLGRGSFCF